MSDTKLKALTGDTVRLIGSSQVITSVYSVVKELVENALDAEASSVEIKLENCGLDKIEVRDNGCGISQENIKSVAKRHHTSKISSFTDLEHLTTYGFRGEALGSLCSVSNLSIVTKTREDAVSFFVTFDMKGEITDSKPSHLGQGTTICASKLFKNLPVRRQIYSTVKKRKEELRKVEDLLMSYAVIRPDVRFSLRNDKDLVWQKSSMVDSKVALQSILGRNVVSKMEMKKVSSVDPELQMELHLPSKSAEVSVTSRSTNDRCFIAVNRRPIKEKDIEKCIRKYFINYHNCDASRFPVFFLLLTIPASELDVNLDPNKSHVMIQFKKDVLSLLTSVLEDVYGPIVTATKPTTETNNNNNNKELLSHDCSFRSTDSELGESPTADKENREVFVRVKDRLTNQNPAVAARDGSLSNRDDCAPTGLRISFYEGNQSDDVTLSNYGDRLEKNTGLVDHQNIGRSANEISQSCSSTTFRKDTLDINGRVDMEDNQLLSDGKGMLTQQDGVLDGNVDKDRNKENVCDVNLTEEQVAEADHNFQIHIQDDDLDKLLCTWADSELGTTSEEMSQSTDAQYRGTVKSVESGKKCYPASGDSSSRFGENLTQSSASTSVLSDHSATQWSRGIELKQTDGQTVQPVRMLVPGSGLGNSKRPLDDSFEGFSPLPPAKRKSFDVQVDQPRLYDFVSSSPAMKNNSGFIAFSKEVRKKVVEENPGSEFDEINRLVRERWSALSEDDKQWYKDAGDQEIQRLKQVVSGSQKKEMTSCAKLQMKQKTVKVVKGLPSIKDQMLQACRGQKTSKKVEVPLKSVKLSFCMQSLRDRLKAGPSPSQMTHISQLNLIGALKLCNGWICCHGNKLQLLVPHCVDEVLLHKQLMENHVLPTQHLEQPIRLHESNVGGTDLWSTLVSLTKDCKSSTYSLVEDKRLLANGLSVRCHSNQSGDSILDLVGICGSIPTYGLEDLREVLDLIRLTGADSLDKARPLKVINYLKGEAVRMAGQRPLQRSRDSVEDLLDQMTQELPAGCNVCLHDKPFLHILYNMEDIPLTQTTDTNHGHKPLTHTTDTNH